ncbi:MAG: flagellar biosynthetic protein FliR [Pseudomonadota bacterium]
MSLEDLALIEATLNETLATGLLVFLRVGAIMALLPALGEQSVPVRVRLGLTLAFTMIVAPMVGQRYEGLGMNAVTLQWVAAEVIAGLVLGIFLRLFILTLQFAGSIAAQATSLSQLVPTPAFEPMPTLGQILVVAAFALATLADLHLRVAEYIVRSYVLFPAGRLPTPAFVLEIGTDRVAASFELAFVLSAPFVAASLLYNVTLGVINRAMPQLMVAFVGAPAITMAALILLMLCAPVMLEVWLSAFNGFMAEPSLRR